MTSAFRETETGHGRAGAGRPARGRERRRAPLGSGARAVLIATAQATDDDGPAAALEWEHTTVLGRLVEQFRELGVGSVVVIARPSFGAGLSRALGGTVEVVGSPDLPGDFRALAAIARAAPGMLVVAQGDIVTQREALAGLLADPRVASGILGSETAHGLLAHRIRAVRSRVASVASPYHRVGEPGGAFLDVLKLAPDELERAAETAERLAGLTAAPLPPDWGDPAGPEDATALLAVGLVRAGVGLTPSWLRELFWARTLAEADVRAARAEIVHHDEDRALLESAVKSIDGFFTTFLVSPYSKYLARWAARRGLTPNAVTSFSMALGVLAAAGFATGERWGLIAGAVLLQIAFTTDCVDGQLARYTRQFSKLGAWLDSVFDRTKEYLVFAGLAIGASRTGDPVWVLAAAALTLQTARHAVDFAYGATQRMGFVAAPQRPLEDPDDGAGGHPVTPAAASPVPPAGGGRRLLGRWRRFDRLPGVLWVKRTIAFPIGERFAVISLTAAIWDARVTFVVLLAWGGLAVAYSVPGRVLRSLIR